MGHARITGSDNTAGRSTSLPASSPTRPPDIRARGRAWIAAHGGRALRFGLVGVSGVIVNYVVLLALVELAGVNPLLAVAVATEISILTNFLINDAWTFRGAGRHRSWPRRLLRYNACVSGGLVISVATLWLLTGFAGLHYLIANAVAIIGAAAWNYLSTTRWAWGIPIGAADYSGD